MLPDSDRGGRPEQDYYSTKQTQWQRNVNGSEKYDVVIIPHSDMMFPLDHKWLFRKWFFQFVAGSAPNVGSASIFDLLFPHLMLLISINGNLISCGDAGIFYGEEYSRTPLIRNSG
ncbi:hypothetical protein AVEN_165527-1 [Araneus ventricosus]|uniref:Uncharacterized protein n=1 Tax=Araneus ventricosus TaxID=182803 RepID=A0A4Y2SME1_ARAVE|nr:hypothetical protein AVEN_165527-1 [Araneus ventricosus]